MNNFDGSADLQRLHHFCLNHETGLGGLGFALQPDELSRLLGLSRLGRVFLHALDKIRPTLRRANVLTANVYPFRHYSMTDPLVYEHSHSTVHDVENLAG